MGWYAIQNRIIARDAQGLAEVLAGEQDAARALELALRQPPIAAGPVIQDKSDSFASYHVWHWCVDCGVPFPHSQAGCDAHREHSIISVPTYRNQADVTPAGAILHMRT